MREITNIVKSGKEFYSIFLDGCFFCKLQAETILKNKIKVGNFINSEDLINIQAEDEKITAFNKSLSYLKNIKTTKQVEDFLFSKGYTNKTVEYCIKKLNEYNYLNDKEFAKIYIKSYSKKKGKRLLEYELKTKGINQEIINELFNDYKNNKEDILFIAQKYLNNKQKDLKTIKKLIQHLFSKGFTYDEINPIINNLYNIGEIDENWD